MPRRLPSQPQQVLSSLDSWSSLDDLQRELFPDLEDEVSPAIGFVSRLFVATTLPHSAPQDSEFTRNSGLYDLCLLAPRRIGLPFGTYPRVAVVDWVTEAVRKQDSFLSLGPSFSSYAFRLGITPSTGPKGTLIQLRDQLTRLANLSVSVVEDPKRAVALGLPPSSSGGGVRLVKQYRFWWDDPLPSDTPHFVQLSDDFFKEVINHPIPIDVNVLRSFRSPLMIDIYMWLTYRSIRSMRINRPEVVSWPALKRLFGSDYTHIRMFRFNFLRALEAVRRVYPEARVSSSRKGLTLLPYPPHVKRVKTG